jgi:hypothetical protein
MAGSRVAMQSFEVGSKVSGSLVTKVWLFLK